MDIEMKKILLFIFVFCTALLAGEIDGSFSTGFYFGTPYWNADNYADDNVIEPDDSFMRSVNHLRLTGKYFDHLTFKIHAVRSDGFQSETRLSETKIYQVYAQYNFSSAMVKLGRFMPLNRWIRGSVDGGGFNFAITEKIKFSAMGGLYSPYGKIYDSDNTLGLGYADISMRGKNIGAKAKVYADEDVTKAGADFYGRYGKLTYSGNYGFDFTNNRIADGGLNLMYALNSVFSLSGNYRLMRTDDWKISYIDFPSIVIERFSLGARYKLFKNYYLDFRHMITMTSELTNYLTYLNFGGKYFYLGANYLSGDSKYERLGFNIAGKYKLFSSLLLTAGFAPVDYVMNEDEDNMQTMSYYFRMNYKLFKSFTISANFNYYQDNEVLDSNMRGGLQLRYNFGSL